jgi:GxxExxY protein
MTEHLTDRIIGLAIKVHRTLGPGLFEAIYETWRCHQLDKVGLAFVRQVPFPLVYDGIRFKQSFLADIVVEETVILDLKSLERLAPVHEAQLKTYMRLSGRGTGLLMYFNVSLLKNGLRRIQMPAVSRAPRTDPRCT